MEEHTKLVIEILAPLMIMIGWMWKNLSKKIDENTTKIVEITLEIRNLDRRLQTIEDRLEFSNKIVYIKQEEAKEN